MRCTPNNRSTTTEPQNVLHIRLTQSQLMYFIAQRMYRDVGFCCRLLIFLFQKLLSGARSDPVQGRRSVGPDLGQNISR